MDTGEIVPYGEPATFAQRTRNRFGSNALPGPINGPHLSVENTSVAVKRNPEVSGAVHAGEQRTDAGRGMYIRRGKQKKRQHAPILHVRTPSERMTDNHHIIPPLIQLPPRFVRNRHVLQGLSAFEGERWEHEDLLVNLDRGGHSSSPEPKSKRRNERRRNRRERDG